MGALLLTLQQHPASKLPASFAPLAPGQEGNMAAVLTAAANQHTHHVLAAWLGAAKIALQASHGFMWLTCVKLQSGAVRSSTHTRLLGLLTPDSRLHEREQRCIMTLVGWGIEGLPEMGQG